MIDRREILESASSYSLLLNIVEKDYILGWILAGINAHDELADELNLSGKTIYEQVSKGHIPYYKIAGSIRFDPVRIAGWLRL
jgi:excisionase family DNA binding protein